MFDIYKPKMVELDTDALVDYLKEYFSANGHRDGIDTSNLNMRPYDKGIFITMPNPHDNIHIFFEFYKSGAVKMFAISFGEWLEEENYEDVPTNYYFFNRIIGDIVSHVRNALCYVNEKYQDKPNESLIHRITENVIRKLCNL